MFRKKYEKAVADWPYTQLLKDGGVHIYGKYVHPMLPGRMLVLVCVIVGPLAYYAAVSAESVAPGVVIIIGSVIAWYAGLRRMLYKMFGKNVDVKVYPDRIAVRQGFGYRNYSREEHIELRVERHQKAQKEEANAIRTGNNSFRVFREAIEVVMQYGEKRVPLAEMRQEDMEMAKALLLRLQNVCAGVDQAAPTFSAGSVAPMQSSPRDFGPAPDIR